jgi:DNA-binding Xre family transcriptional regulator
MIEPKVREVAERNGIKSSYELQHTLGVVPTVAVRLWRNKVTRFSLDILDKLCVAFDCQPGDLLTYKEDAANVNKKIVARAKNKSAAKTN